MIATCNTNVFIDRKTRAGRTYSEKAINDMIHLLKEATVIVLLEEPGNDKIALDRSFGIAKRGYLEGNRFVIDVELVNRELCTDIVKVAWAKNKRILLKLDMKASVCDDPAKCNPDNQWIPGVVYGVSGIRYAFIADMMEWE